LPDAVVKPLGAGDAAESNCRDGEGFTLYMLKAVLNGRADEIVELARSKLLR
jgi:pyruvate dehydrogenase (quinone)